MLLLLPHEWLLMKRSKILSAFLVELLLIVPGLCFSQDVTGGNDSEPVKVGIALSSGGAKGFAHVGVLKVLEEENIPIHVVTGTSIGAVVGGLYAAGYTPHQIQNIALSTDWQILFNDNLKPSSRDLSTFISTRDTYLLSFPIVDKRPQLPTGLIGGQNISMLLYRLLLPYHSMEDFSDLPVSFAAIATELSTGKARRFESGYLPDVIRASAAIPSIFKPVSIADTLYIDGGVARSIPTEDARALGADIVLVSDVTEPVKPVESLDNFVNVLFQSIGFHQMESDTVQIKMADFYIRPEIEEYNSFSYDKVKELIEKGEKAARAAVPKIRAVLDSVRTAKAPQKPDLEYRYRNPVLNITNVDYENVDAWLLRQTEIVMDLHPPEKLTYSDIEQKVNRLYATGFFSLISYRVKDDSTSPGGKTLEMNFTYSKPDRLGFSMRYNSRYKASLLFGVQLRNTFASGDRFLTDLRLGEILGVSTHYDVPFSLKPVVSFNTDLEIHRSPIDLYALKEQLATVEVEQISLLPSFLIQPVENIKVQAGIKAEYYSLKEIVGEDLFASDDRFLLNGVASLTYDNLNRVYFPTRGQRLRVTAEMTSEQFLSEATFSQLIADWQASIPVFEGVEIRTRITAGQSSTTELPLHYRFYRGGLMANPLFDRHQAPFWGYATQQLSGSGIAAIQVGLQVHMGNDVYLQTGWNAAHLSESKSWKPNDLDLNHGFGISLGALTLIGPVNLSLSTPDFKENYAFKVDVGYSF